MREKGVEQLYNDLRSKEAEFESVVQEYTTKIEGTLFPIADQVNNFV